MPESKSWERRGFSGAGMLTSGDRALPSWCHVWDFVISRNHSWRPCSIHGLPTGAVMTRKRVLARLVPLTSSWATARQEQHVELEGHSFPLFLHSLSLERPLGGTWRDPGGKGGVLAPHCSVWEGKGPTATRADFVWIGHVVVSSCRPLVLMVVQIFLPLNGWSASIVVKLGLGQRQREGNWWKLPFCFVSRQFDLWSVVPYLPVFGFLVEALFSGFFPICGRIQGNSCPWMPASFPIFSVSACRYLSVDSWTMFQNCYWEVDYCPRRFLSFFKLIYF